ncbi:MAG TPA: acetyl-CoA carboxylase carboxyltransferase subunit alpha [Terracidiphilus sp.]|nr:acetyl-CoA carboxylase carboxyltransferase subunit alpha [Terracidiphilus sp.]
MSRALRQSEIAMSEQVTATPQAAQPVSAAWLKVEKARHPQRPYPMDFIEQIFTDFSEIHGDRAFGDDEAVACGMARLDGEEVMVIANRKGGSTKERVRRNFGMPSPEGYRKALRCMKIAEKFRRPVISLIDLPGAYPGVGAEERGQGEAIARNLREMSRLRVPTISVISGEGGSGGALALAVSDRVLLLENALYFVISPEGCAAIMWNDASRKDRAAEAMRISAPEVMDLGCIDEIIREPEGGAHADPESGIGLLGAALTRHLRQLLQKPVDDLVLERQQKFRTIARFYSEG